jgi:hypothetical protein
MAIRISSPEVVRKNSLCIEHLEQAMKKAAAIPTSDELLSLSQGNSFEVRKEHDHSDITEILQP